MVPDRIAQLSPWVMVGLLMGGSLTLAGHAFEHEHLIALAQLTSVTIAGGGLALCAYLSALHPSLSWTESLRRTAPGELLKYWWWPGMAFASTYYLVIMGVVLFVGRQPSMTTIPACLGGALVTAMMGLYGYYLGYRRQIEDQERPQLSAGMLRCPFVMGILGKTAVTSTADREMALQKAVSKG